MGSSLTTHDEQCELGTFICISALRGGQWLQCWLWSASEKSLWQMEWVTHWHRWNTCPGHPFAFYPVIKLLYTQLKSVFFLLHFNKFLLDILSKSPTFSQLIPVVIPSVPIIQDVKWKSPWYINPLTSRWACTNTECRHKQMGTGKQKHNPPPQPHIHNHHHHLAFMSPPPCHHLPLFWFCLIQQQHQSIDQLAVLLKGRREGGIKGNQGEKGGEKKEKQRRCHSL